MEEELLMHTMLLAYRNLAPEAGRAGEYLIKRLAALLFAQGVRATIGNTLPPEKRIVHQSMDPDMRLVWVSKAWNQTMGFRSRDAIGRHVSDILNPLQLSHYMEETWPDLLKHGSTGPYDISLVTTSGQHLSGTAKSEIMRDPEGLFVRTFTRITLLIPRSV